MERGASSTGSKTWCVTLASVRSSFGPLNRGRAALALDSRRRLSLRNHLTDQKETVSVGRRSATWTSSEFLRLPKTQSTV